MALLPFNCLHNLATPNVKRKDKICFVYCIKCFVPCLLPFATCNGGDIALPHMINKCSGQDLKGFSNGLAFGRRYQNLQNVNEAKDIFAFTQVFSQFYWCNTAPQGALSPAIYIKCGRLQVQIAPPTDIEHGPQWDEKPFRETENIRFYAECTLFWIFANFFNFEFCFAC